MKKVEEEVEVIKIKVPIIKPARNETAEGIRSYEKEKIRKREINE